MVAEVVRGLESRFPWLSTWLGSRLEFELPAFMVSVAMHGLLLVGLAFAGYRVHREVQREFRSGAMDNVVPLDSAYQDLDQTADPPAPVPAAGSFAPTLAPTITSAPSSAGGVPVSAQDGTRALPPQLAKLDVQRVTELVAPSAPMLAQNVSIRGNGAEMIGSVEGAVDQIATEIVRQLEQGRTLVVWAFDASWSLLAERQRLGKHIETVYAHINQLDERHLTADNGLMTMVVSFGHDRHAMLPKPTAERSEIIEAINKVPLDETGIETTFATVAEIVKLWGRYKDAHNQSYHTMVIVVTDEKGDDEDRLEDAVALARPCRTALAPNTRCRAR